MDLSGLMAEESVPDRVLVRCGKEERFIDGFPRAVRSPATESCERFLEFDPRRSRWEWDDEKNKKNIEKHGISFQCATSALDLDKNSVRHVAKTWEDLSNLNYEEKGIQRSFANSDPVRDVYLFEHDQKIWVLVSTLRGEFGLISQRVISVRRARSEEQAAYHAFADRKIRE